MTRSLPLTHWGLPENSRVISGKTWPRPEGAERVRELNVYRHNPEDDQGPRVDTYFVDPDRCGPMVLDALITIKDGIDSSLTFRRSCREGICGSCSMNIDGRNTLACIQPLSEIDDPVRVYPLNHLRVIKDLVPDLEPIFAQYEAIEPWLKTSSPRPERERLQSPEERARIEGYDDCILCFCCTTACPSWWWNGSRFFGPAVLLQAGRWIEDSRDEATGERLGQLHDPYRLYRCHTIFNCTMSCPKGLNPAKAIATIKRQIAERGG